MGGFEKYLLIVNIIGFVLYLINMGLYSYTEFGQIDLWLTVTAIIGGSLGIIVAILLFDRHACKGNMMSRVFVSCVFVIQVVVVLIYKGHLEKTLTFAFWSFFASRPALLHYLLIINIISFLVYGFDKLAAIEGMSRIRIVTLLGLAFAGGSIGAIIAMYLFNHKTSKDYFAVGIPMIIVTQLVVLFFLMNGRL